MSLEGRTYFMLWSIQLIYYPLLAAVSVPVNLLTIAILSRGKCGLSKCVTRYLVSMAAADLLVVITDLILRQIPIVYRSMFAFLRHFPVCNIHAVLLYAVTDCSVWFTVTFTFDRFVAICCQKLKTKYCTEKTAAVVLGTVSVLSCLKNIFWYFMFEDPYLLSNTPWFCFGVTGVSISPMWTGIEFLHYLLTPGVPFVLILLLNALTVRHILVASRARRRLRGHSNRESPSDPEMENRRKSIILLFVISGNFILLWALFLVSVVSQRMFLMGYSSLYLPAFVKEMGFILQLLSCCTNTCIYAMTQTKFREQLKNVVKYPFIVIVRLIE
ncbi:probable G-protein coupled receptor 139 [Heptranchias perlo]|uniref:probable G-protein coupled receptor 139 n=1 Tax=Heptranchias perlo TaxID=212740 RepID=UPI00355A160B